MLFHLFVVSAFCVIFNWGLIANVQANIFTGDCYLQFNKMTMIVQFKKKYFYTGKNAFVFASSENLTVTIYYETLFLRLKISISCFFFHFDANNCAAMCEPLFLFRSCLSHTTKYILCKLQWLVNNVEKYQFYNFSGCRDVNIHREVFDADIVYITL